MELKSGKKLNYTKTSQKDVDKLFHKTKAEIAESTEETRDAPGDLPQEVLGPEFAIIDPIPTIVGPLGKFQVVPESFPKHASIGLFGKRRTGKSFTARWWMYNAFRDIEFGVVFTHTKINGFWSKYIPDYLVFQGLPIYQMKRLIARQKKLISDWKKEHAAETKADPDAYKEAPELRAFVIFDDVISDQAVMRWNTEINSFFVEGRHLCVTVFICTQHNKGIGPMLRGNLDIACIQPMFQKEGREVLADLFGGFMDKKVFMAMMDEVVQDINLEGSTPQEPKKYVRTLVINDFENTRNPQVKFRWSDAENPDDIENWRLLNDEYWKQQDNRLTSAPPENFEAETKDLIDDLDSLLYD